MSMILNWFRTINFLTVLWRIYPIVKAAVEEATREASDNDEWTDDEKKAFAIKFIRDSAAASGISLSPAVNAVIPDFIEFVYRVLVKPKHNEEGGADDGV